MSNARWIPATGDAEWHERTTLRFAINPSLPAHAHAALKLEFLLEGQDSLVLSGICKALAFYIDRRLGRIDQRFGIPLRLPLDAVV